MMNRSTGLVALLGSATLASAQTATLSYSVRNFGGGIIALNTTYTIDVRMSFEGGRDSLLAIDYSLAFDGAIFERADNFVIDADFLAQGGSVTSGPGSLEVNTLGPTNLFAPAAGSPQALFTFDLTTGSERSSLRLTHSDWLITTFNSQFATSDHDLVDSDTTWPIPSPGVLGVAGLGALVGARRRRN